MRLTYYGHASFAVAVAGKTLLFDPFISPNPAARHIAVNELLADYVLLSHGHADHVADAPALVQRTGATVIASAEVAGWMEQQGASGAIGMNHGGKKNFDFGAVKCVHAVHSSGLPDGSYGGNPMGFVVTSDEGNFYYSGDTALTLDMQLIPRWARLNFAVLCIGDHFTMGYEDAVEAARMCGATRVVGVHYNTFPPIAIDVEAARKAFTNAGIELILPAIGETVTF